MVLSCIVAEVAFWKMVAAHPHERFFENQLWTMWQSGRCGLICPSASTRSAC